MDCKYTRREFFRDIGLGTLGLGFGVSIFDSIFHYAGAFDTLATAITEDERHSLLTKGTVNFKGFKAAEITPNERFYITTYSDKTPRIDASRFTLRVEGMVERPYTISLKELESMKDKTEYVTLECIGNPVGGDSISNALWEGVTLKKVLERAQPKKGIVKTVFFAEDGYSDSIPFDLSVSDDVFLAWRMNGEPLPPVHGYPLRAIVPGIYGMKNAKWISKIELVNYNFKGYWEKKGWSDEAVIPIKSQILMPMEGKTVPPGNYVVGGTAFAGRYGISRVEVSLDGGKTWNETETKKPLSRWAWTLWRYDWKPEKAETYTLKVRGIDSSGKAQESGTLLGKVFGTFPDGAKGIHSVDVRAVKR